MALKGKKLSPEHVRKISESNKSFFANGGELNSGVFRKGYNHSQEAREKMSKTRKGSKGYWTGKKRLSISGDKSHFWKGGITPINAKIRHSLEYKMWRQAVFIRDNYTCIWCGKKGGEMNADHIKPFAYYPELRFAIDNGRTLCIDCHKKTETFGWKLIN